MFLTLSLANFPPTYKTKIITNSWNIQVRHAYTHITLINWTRNSWTGTEVLTEKSVEKLRDAWRHLGLAPYSQTMYQCRQVRWLRVWWSIVREILRPLFYLFQFPVNFILNNQTSSPQTIKSVFHFTGH